MMNKPNLYTAQLKLKRHNLSLKLTNNDNDVQLGGIVNLTSEIVISIILPTIVAITFIILSFVLKIGVIDLLGYGILIYVFYQFTVLKQKKDNNKNTKIIRNGELEINSNNTKELFRKDSIKNFNTNIQLITRETFEGKLLLTDLKNEEHVILSLYDEDKRQLEDDLIYLKKFIENKINSSLPSTK